MQRLIMYCLLLATCSIGVRGYASLRVERYRRCNITPAPRLLTSHEDCRRTLLRATPSSSSSSSSSSSPSLSSSLSSPPLPSLPPPPPPPPPPQDALFYKRVFSLGALVAQNTALILLMRASRVTSGAASAMYISSTAVVMCEAIKVVVSLVGYFVIDCRSSVSAFWRKCRHPTFAWWEIVGISVPALLYVIQNNLQYLAVSSLPAEVYQVLIQGKIITTAVFSALVLHTRYSFVQWASVVALAAGVGLVQLSLAEGTGAAAALFSTSATQSVSRNFPVAAVAAATASTHVNLAVGIPSVLVSTLTSGFAAVYLERMLKRKEGFWARNIQLSVVSLFIALLGAYIKDAAAIGAKGFLHGYNPLVLSVVLTQALGGLLVAFVVRYSNSVMKGFATSGSIILSCLLSTVVLHEQQFNALFVVGAGLVSGAAAAWAVFPSRPPAAEATKAGVEGLHKTEAAASGPVTAASEVQVGTGAVGEGAARGPGAVGGDDMALRAVANQPVPEVSGEGDQQGLEG